MRRWKVAIALAIIGCASPGATSGQVPVDSLQWTRVRITTWDPTARRVVRVGILSRVTSDSLVLAQGKRVVGVPRDRVLRVETSNGGSGLKGAVAGFFLGAAAAVFVLDSYFDAHYLDDSENYFYALLYGVPTGGPLGASIGGALLRERWSPVALTPAGDGTWAVSLRMTTPW